MIENVTCIIKSFRRPDSLEKLYFSIRQFYPDIPIIIVDDSGFIDENGNVIEPMTKAMAKAWNNDPNTIFDRAPFDIGLSEGRNRALKLTTTDYFVLLDDDFSFDKRTNLELFKQYLEQYSLDILGGRLDEGGALRGMCKLMFIQESVLLNKDGYYNHYDSNVFITDKVYNFFIGRTHTMRQHGWDPRLKLCEHTYFFLKAKTNNIRVGYTPYVIINHHLDRPTADYRAFRNRGKAVFDKIILDEFKISKVVF